MEPSAPGAAREGMPLRLVSRLSNELHLSGVESLNRLGCATYDQGIVFIVLLRLCLADWTRGGRLAPPASPTRLGSVRGLARALDRSTQTVRRHLRALVEQGFCRMEEGGYAVETGAANAARVVPYCLEVHDILLRLIQDLPSELLPKPPRARPPPPPARIVEVGLDVQLVPFEALGGKLGDWTSMLVWSMIGTANTRPVMLDPVLSRRFAVQPTPDSLRRPVSLKAVASAVGLPYATAWRHAERLHAAGLLTRLPEGWLLAGRHLQRPEVEASVRELVQYYLRKVGALVGEGLDPAEIDERYALARPAFVPFR